MDLSKVQSKILKNHLNVYDNNPIHNLKVGDTNLSGFINIGYCCFNTGWGSKHPGTLEDRESILIDAITTNSAILILIECDSIPTFRGKFHREMHWIRQSRIRLDRFAYILELVYNKCESLVSNIDDLDTYINENISDIISLLPVQQRQYEIDL